MHLKVTKCSYCNNIKSYTERSQKMALPIRIWLKLDYSFTTMSYYGFLYYIIFRQWLRPLALYNKIAKYYQYDNFCVTWIKYILHNDQDYSVFIISYSPSYEFHFTHIWKALAWMHHFTKRWFGPI